MTFNELRLATGLSAQEIADLAGVKIRQAYRWQAEEARAPKLVLDAMKQVLNSKKAKKIN